MSRHKHVIQILGVCDDKHNPAYVMEKMENGSLMDHLHKVFVNVIINCNYIIIYYTEERYTFNWFKIENSF